MKADDIIPSLRRNTYVHTLWADTPDILAESEFRVDGYGTKGRACLALLADIKRWLSGKDGLLWVRIAPDAGPSAEVPTQYAWSAYCKLALVPGKRKRK